MCVWIQLPCVVDIGVEDQLSDTSAASMATATLISSGLFSVGLRRWRRREEEEERWRRRKRERRLGFQRLGREEDRWLLL